MRNFRCSSCGHEFTVPFCNGQRGNQMKCPQCGEAAVRTNYQGGGGKFRGACLNNGGNFGRGRGGNFGRGNGSGRWCSGNNGRGRRASI